jgi:hypothetical protein
MAKHARTAGAGLLLVLLTFGCVTQVTGEENEGSPEGTRATHFVFTKKGDLLSPAPKMPRPGPYYTCLVEMKGVEKFPFDYALYFSTDHGHKGGVWMYVCNGVPTVSENWKSYDRAIADGDFDYLAKKPKANPVFCDQIQGTSTETPHANVIDGTVYMTYHNKRAGHSQSTLLATSKDGVNFFRINGKKDSVVIDYDPNGAPGNGHTGYFRWGPNPFSGVKYKYVGYSLHGGGGRSHSAMWGSDDAVKWHKLEVLDHVLGHAMEKGIFIRWIDIDPASIRSIGNGEYAALCSGGNRERVPLIEVYEIFLADDGRTLTRHSRKVLGLGSPGTSDEQELGQPTTAAIGNAWYLLYVGVGGKKGSGGSAGINTVMKAVGTFDKSASKSTPLKQEDRTRHFMRKQAEKKRS